MSNELNLASLSNISVSNSTERLAVTNNNQYYWWDNFNQSYNLLDTSSITSDIDSTRSINQVDSDDAGNFYFLVIQRDPWQQPNPQYYLYSWNSSSQEFDNGASIPLSENALANDFIDFTAINSDELWMVNNSRTVQQYLWNSTTERYDLGFYGLLGTGVNLGDAQAITTGKEDGSVWALDTLGNLYSWDGTNFGLFNGGNNPAFQQIFSLNSQSLFGLDNEGNIYAWSSFGNTFIELDDLIGNLPIFEEIQVDEQGILYGITNQTNSYYVGNISSILSLNNSSGQPFGLTTVTDDDGVTHAIWNQNGQILYGYQPDNSNGQYIGVTTLDSGIGTTNQGSSSDLTLTQTDNDQISAYWIAGNGDNAEVYTASLSPSIYGGYQWSEPIPLTDDDVEDQNLEVTTLIDNQVLVTTQKNNQTASQIVDQTQAPVTENTNIALAFEPKGKEFTYQITSEDLNSSSGFVPIPSDSSIEVGLGTANLPNLSSTVKKALNGFSVSLNAAIDTSTKQYSSQSPVALNQLKLGLNIGKKAGGVVPAVQAESLAAGLFKGYVSLDFSASAQGSGEWQEVSSYPSIVKAKAGADVEFDVNAINLVLDSLLPGTSTLLSKLSEAGFLSINGGPLLALGLKYSTKIEFNDEQTSLGSVKPSDYFFKLVDENGNPPTEKTPRSELQWQLYPGKFFSFLVNTLDDTENSDFNINIDTGLYLNIGLLKGFIDLSIKGVQTEEFNHKGLAKAFYTNKAKAKFNFFLFSISYGSYIRIVEPVPEGTQEAITNQNLKELPATVSYEPNSTAHLIQASSSELLQEDINDLIESSDISYIVAPNGSTVYGTFAGAVDDDSANLSYLYFVSGNLENDGSIEWNIQSVEPIANTAGANQRPNIALDANGNVVIAWQYESISNPTVEQIATTPPGQVYVVYGQTENNGVDLSNFPQNPENASASGFYWTLNNEYFASFGQEVTTLGDVNIGGKADLAMTAPDLNDEQGGVYIVFGEQYNQVNDPNNLGSNGLFLTGQALSELGYSIANAGDVNDDGKSDLIIGAPGLNNDQGGAYLLYGGTLFENPQTISNIDALLQANPSYGQQITNPDGQAGDRLGTVVTGGYDFNGDGQADYAISAPNANQESGEITLILSQFIANELFTLSMDDNGNLVLFNQTTNTEVWNSNTAHLVPLPEYASYYEAVMESNGNFVLYEWAGNAQLSYWSTNTSGNRGAYLALAPDGGLYIRNQQGDNIYTLHQGTNPSDVMVSRLDGGNGISSDDADSSLTSPNSGGGPITLTNDTSAVNGEPLLDMESVTLIPDVNQDGKADLLIGGTGAAVILFGANLSTQTLDLATVNPEEGFVILDDLDNPAPLQTSSAGDVNGDGINDLIVGYPATQDANGNFVAGNSYVVFGSGSLYNNQDNVLGFSELNGTNGFTISGAGTEVTSAGDLNGDGVGDLIVAEPQGGNNQAGVSYVIYGGTENNIGTVASISVSDVGTTVQGYVIGQGGDNQLSGSSVSALGDLNGDGQADLLVGAPNTVSTDALNQLQQTIASNYVVGQVSNGTLNTHNSAPTPLPWLQEGQAIESLTSTPFGVVAVWTTQVGTGETAQTNLATAFWIPSGTSGSWRNYTPNVATLYGENQSFSGLNVGVTNNDSNNSITLSWVVQDSETGTSSLGQSIYNGSRWETTNSIQTDTAPTPPAEIDNIISDNTSSSDSNFSINHQKANEQDEKVIFTIERQEDISSTKTFNYRTVDISATAGADYEHTEGSITFAPGETSKTIEVNIYEDSLNEHLNEKLQLVLSDGQQTSLTAYATLQDANPEINLLAIDSGFSMTGPVNDLLGHAVGGAGNVNNDNNSNNNNAPLDDFWISAPGDNNSTGTTYIVFGSQGVQVQDQGLDLDHPQSGQQVLKITGESTTTAASPQSGSRLSAWSGSSQTWYAIAAPNTTNQGGSNDSEIYVFDKSAITQTSGSIDLNSLANSPIKGNSSDGFGETILLADVNGDGTPELIVGSPLADKVQIYQLSGSGKNITTTLLTTIMAPNTGQGLGSSLQVLDLNGDGKQDLALGAPSVNPVTDPNNSTDIRGYGGAIYVVSGTTIEGATPNNPINLTSTSSSTNWVFDGSTSFAGENINGQLNPSTGKPSKNPATNYAFYDGVGNALATLDLNGDNHLDLVIGAPNASVGNSSNPTNNLGKVYVLFGGENSFPSNLSEIEAGQGVTFAGVLASGQAGWAVANGGDVNNDHIDDLLIGAPFAYGNAGSTYTVFGSKNAFTGGGEIYLDPNLTDSRVFQYQGVANPLSNSNLANPGNVGQSLNGIGDINGDYGSSTGGDDIILGAPSSNDGDEHSEAYVAIGHPWLQGGLSLNVNDLRSDNGFIEVNPNAAVGVGDVNGDGFDDFVNVSTEQPPSGNQLTLGASTLSNTSAQRTYPLNLGNDSIISDSVDLIASGDFNADGYADFVQETEDNVVVNYGNNVLETVLSAQAPSLAALPSNLSQIVSGDINGDGYDDLLALGDTNKLNGYLGSVSGFSSQPAFSLPISIPNPDSNFEGIVPTLTISATDLNADGIDEVFILAGFNNQAEGFSEVGEYYIAPTAWQYANGELQAINSALSPQEIFNVYDPFAEFYPFGNQNQITSGDFNGDGYLDLLMANYAYYGFFGSESDVTAVDQVQVFYGGAQLSQFGHNSQVLRSDFPSEVLTSSAQLSTALGDVNADGYDDILLSQIGPGTQASLRLGDTSNPLETSIPVQGLPNRRTVYQQGTAGDINGDGYNDLLMSDFDYKLTYAIYGQDWLTETEHNSNPATYTFFDGTNGNDVFTIPENVSTPKIVLRGQNGDDYMLIPAANSSQIYAFGGEGDDQIGLGGALGTDSEVIGKIDGGGGFDTIFIPQTVGQQTRLYLDAKTGHLTSIEAIDIGYNNSVQFNQSTLLQMLDGNKKLFINGVNSTVYNSDNSSVVWNKIGVDAYDGISYTIYGILNSAVEVWVEQGLPFKSLKGGQSWGTDNNDYLDFADSPGNNRVNLEAGNDTVIGSRYRDILKGEGGHDVLYGSDGVDKLFGGDDNDILDGGSGGDFLYGGLHSDSFFIRHENGIDRIMDFNPTEGDLFSLDELEFGDLTFLDHQIFHGNDLLAVVFDHQGNPLTNLDENSQWFTQG